MEAAIDQTGEAVDVITVGNARGRNVSLNPLSLLDPGAMVFTSGTAARPR